MLWLIDISCSELGRELKSYVIYNIPVVLWKSSTSKLIYYYCESIWRAESVSKNFFLLLLVWDSQLVVLCFDYGCGEILTNPVCVVGLYVEKVKPPCATRWAIFFGIAMSGSWCTNLWLCLLCCCRFVGKSLLCRCTLTVTDPRPKPYRQGHWM